MTELRALSDPRSLGGPEVEELTEFFGPFLRYFVAETARSGGEVLLANDEGRVAGVLLGSEVERLGTVFSRSTATAEMLRDRHPGWSIFTERELSGPHDTFRVYRGHLDDLDMGPLDHPIRAVEGGDLPAVRGLLERSDGPINPRWFTGIPSATEQGVVAEDRGRVVGVGWLSSLGGFARLHSLAVEPRYRRLGIATALVRARLRRARALGADSVISEIAEENGPSRAIAERLGFEVVGRMFLHAPRASPRSDLATTEGLRTPDSS
jgi:ribosomal protein S18 acetylase RimI-like enzyme